MRRIFAAFTAALFAFMCVAPAWADPSITWVATYDPVTHQQTGVVARPLIISCPDGTCSGTGGGGGGGAVTDTRAVDQTLNSATSNIAYTVLLNNQATVGLSIAGLTASGATLTVEGSNNIGAGTPTWAAINAVTGATQASTLTADGNYRIEGAGRTAVRLRVSSTGSGTITISSNASPAVSLVTLGQPVGVKGVDGVSIASVANPFPISVNGTLPAFASPPAVTVSSGAITVSSGSITITSGNITVSDGSGPLTVDGTVNLGTLNGAALDASVLNPQGTVAPGAAASKSQLAGLVYNSTAPAPTNGQGAAVQGNVQGDLYAAHPRDYAATYTCSATCNTTNGGVLWTSITPFPAGQLPYDTIAINFVGNGTGTTFVLEETVDGGTTWNTVNTQTVTGTATTFATSVSGTSTTISVGRIYGNGVRIRATAYTSGTINGALTMRSTPQTLGLSSVVLSSGSALVGQVNEGGNSYTHVTTNATTTMKSGSTVLHACTINTKGASANTATIYDSTTGSGTVFAVLDTTGTATNFIFDATLATGLTVVTATGTAPDLTCAWR